MTQQEIENLTFAEGDMLSVLNSKTNEYENGFLQKITPNYIFYVILNEDLSKGINTFESRDTSQINRFLLTLDEKFRYGNAKKLWGYHQEWEGNFSVSKRRQPKKKITITSKDWTRIDYIDDKGKTGRIFSDDFNTLIKDGKIELVKTPIQDTFGLLSTDQRTWNAEYKEDDKVVLRSDMAKKAVGFPIDQVYEIIEVTQANSIKRKDNPSGKIYTLSKGGGDWEGKDIELATTPSVTSQPSSNIQLPFKEGSLIVDKNNITTKNYIKKLDISSGEIVLENILYGEKTTTKGSSSMGYIALDALKKSIDNGDKIVVFSDGDSFVDSDGVKFEIESVNLGGNTTSVKYLEYYPNIKFNEFNLGKVIRDIIDGKTVKLNPTNVSSTPAPSTSTQTSAPAQANWLTKITFKEGSLIIDKDDYENRRFAIQKMDLSKKELRLQSYVPTKKSIIADYNGDRAMDIIEDLDIQVDNGKYEVIYNVGDVFEDNDGDKYTIVKADVITTSVQYLKSGLGLKTDDLDTLKLIKSIKSGETVKRNPTNVSSTPAPSTAPQPSATPQLQVGQFYKNSDTTNVYIYIYEMSGGDISEAAVTYDGGITFPKLSQYSLKRTTELFIDDINDGSKVLQNPPSIPYNKGDKFYFKGFPSEVFKIDFFWNSVAGNLIVAFVDNDNKIDKTATIERFKKLIDDGDVIFIKTETSAPSSTASQPSAPAQAKPKRQYSFKEGSFILDKNPNKNYTRFAIEKSDVNTGEFVYRIYSSGMVSRQNMIGGRGFEVMDSFEEFIKDDKYEVIYNVGDVFRASSGEEFTIIKPDVTETTIEYKKMGKGLEDINTLGLIQSIQSGALVKVSSTPAPSTAPQPSATPQLQVGQFYNNSNTNVYTYIYEMSGGDISEAAVIYDGGIKRPILSKYSLKSYTQLFIDDINNGTKVLQNPPSIPYNKGDKFYFNGLPSEVFKIDFVYDDFLSNLMVAFVDNDNEIDNTTTIEAFKDLIDDGEVIFIKTETPATAPQKPVAAPLVLSADEERYNKLKKDSADILSIKSTLSNFQFEDKVNVDTLLENLKKEMDALWFKITEDKMGENEIVDKMFEQSFMPIQRRYDLGDANLTGDNFAPNGQISEIPDSIYNITKSADFKEWFGDYNEAYKLRNVKNSNIDVSQVMTENYEPQLVWHGTGREFSYFIFNSFPAAYFAVNPSYAEWFAREKGGQDGGYLLPFFLDIRRPLDLTLFGVDNISPEEFFDWIYLQTGLDRNDLGIYPMFLSNSKSKNFKLWMFLRYSPDFLVKIRESNVFDGIIFYENNPQQLINGVENTTKAYIIFHPEQCKLAVPDRGTLLQAALKSFVLKKGGKI